MKRKLFAAAACAAPIALAHPALAAPGDAVGVAEGLSLDPILEGRLRYESVDQPASEADAVTLRLRAGAELKHASGLALLAEAEGTAALANDYNAFPFAIADRQRRPQYSTIPDPENLELNRLQLQYKVKSVAVTLGRQRINLDDQRWIGSVGWRQNEQTFDAVRGEATMGPVSLDATYAISQRTIFGAEAGPRTAYDGDFALLGASAKLGSVTVKGFAYLLDYDEAIAAANSSQTYGIRAVANVPLSPRIKLNLAASFARQSDYGSNPFDYSADYIAAEAGLAAGGLTVTAGYEKLGADNGRSLQTPLATLHKFNGWADIFLTTPAAGLEDWHGTASYRFDKVKLVPNLTAAMTWHRFESDIGRMHYGDEWDASLGFRLGTLNLLAKYARYDAAALGADTEKLWLQAEFAF